MSEIHSTEQLRGNARRRDASRGMALVTTLLLLMVMMAMTLAMVIAVTSDTLITKYYRNARTSFYAADSGVNIARQAMLSSLSGAALTDGQTFTSGTLPTLSSHGRQHRVGGREHVVRQQCLHPRRISGELLAQFVPGCGNPIGHAGDYLGRVRARRGQLHSDDTVLFDRHGGWRDECGPYTCTNPPYVHGHVQRLLGGSGLTAFRIRSRPSGSRSPTNSRLSRTRGVWW